MWRCSKNLPERGRIGIFNRSYYEEVLVVRVHDDLLAKEKLPPELVTKRIWKDRYRDIRNYERYLDNNGVVVRKFFLHVSRKEQKRRFLERIDNPAKNWKFSATDAAERRYWKQYMDSPCAAVRGVPRDSPRSTRWTATPSWRPEWSSLRPARGRCRRSRGSGRGARARARSRRDRAAASRR